MALISSSSDATDAPPRTFLGLSLGPAVVTGRKHATWSAMLMLCLVWFTWGFHIFAGGLSLTYTVKRYDGDPRVISLLTTLNVIIMLGPFLSYISDNVWTPIGRRKPFLLVAWGAGTVGMASLAFLPQITGAINAVLGPLPIPALTEFVLLAIIIVCYTTLWDFAAPLEPLFIESVPPHQRGRFFAVRAMFMSVASLMFYQILWPVYDTPLDMLGWLGVSTDAFSLRGEQVIYVLSASLFFVTGAFLLLGVREEKVADAPNKRLRDLNIKAFTIGFFKDVFFAKECYIFYIVMVVPGLAGAVWGSFDALMKTDQFGWSKAAMALMGLPAMLLNIFLLGPFAGWYSDKKPALRPWMMAAVLLGSIACFVASVWLYYEWKPVDDKALPPFWECMMLNTLIAVGSLGFFVLVVELVLLKVGRQHMRAWVSIIAILKELVLAIVTYVILQMSTDKTPPITFWMAFSQFSGALGALMYATIAPLLFEYIPRNKMGTINAGVGVYSAVLKFGIANAGAWWVVFFSTMVIGMAAGAYDYTSMYLLQIGLMIPGVIAKVFFLRQILSGRLQPRGVLEVEGVEGLEGDGPPKG